MPDERQDLPVILCVDDEASILRSLERCLVPEGYRILKASSGAEALQRLEQRQGKVDLVIIDQKMPEMMGDEFLEIAHGRYGRFTSIMLSAYADIEELSRAITVGRIARFLAKPWNNQELVRIVQEVLRPAAK